MIVRVFAAVALLSLCGACSTMGSADSDSAKAAQPCRATAKLMARLELFFGTGRAGGEPVSEKEWTSFLDSEVTPRFPDGLTVFAGRGQWRSNGGAIVKERSLMLAVWYEPTSEREAEIEAIRSAYKKRFGQDSVLRVDGVSCVSF